MFDKIIDKFFILLSFIGFLIIALYMYNIFYQKNHYIKTDLKSIMKENFTYNNTLKYKEMLNPSVMVQTEDNIGSGTIIRSFQKDKNSIIKYIVLTNSHVTITRLKAVLKKVNSLRGKSETEIRDTGCVIITFDHYKKNYDYHLAKVIAEDIENDISLLSFTSDKKFNTAFLATKEMITNINIFDEVFAIGCQLGRIPSPTAGIISNIIESCSEDKKLIFYGNTTHITPGSSGGGLFKKYGGHYYLIGIPYKVVVANNGQFVPHLSTAISLSVARNFIKLNIQDN